MVKERGYAGGPEHFRRVVERLRPKEPAEAFQRLRTLPGDQGQVDWAHFGKPSVGRALRPLWASVVVLSSSRRPFLRFFRALRCRSSSAVTSRRPPTLQVFLACCSTTTSRAPCSSDAKRGTEVAVLFYTLLETAKLHNVDPARYLREAVLSAHRGEVLLPWQLDTAPQPP